MLASADRVRVTVRFYLVVRGRFKCHPGKFPAKNRYEGYCGRRNVSVHMSSTHVAGLPGWLRGWLAAHFGPLRQRCRPAVPEVDPKWTRNDTLRPTSEPALLRPTSTHFGGIPRDGDTPATGDGGASGRGGSRFWPRSAAPLGKAALAARRRRIFFHYWAVQIAHPPSENRGEVMLCHRLHPATILRVLSAFFALLLSLSCAGLALLQLCSS